MADPKDIPVEEQELEAEAQAEAKEEEIKSKVIEEYGFDSVDDAEKIDKLTKERMASHKKLTVAVGQKIKYRDAKPAPVTPPKPDKKDEKAPEPVDVGKAVTAELEKRDLEALEYPAELKTEIQRIATAQGTGIKAALRDPYIVFKVGEYEKEQKQEAATIGNKNKGGGGKNTFTPGIPPDVDMSTEEGRKTYDRWKEWEKSQGR